MSTLRYAGPGSASTTASATTSSIPRRRTIVGREVRDACLGLPVERSPSRASRREGRSARSGPGRPCPRRQAGASSCRGCRDARRLSVPVSVWASKWTRPSGPCFAAHARSAGRVIEWSPPRVTGIGACRDDLADRSLDRRARRLDLVGHDRRVAVVDQSQLVHRVDPGPDLRAQRPACDADRARALAGCRAGRWRGRRTGRPRSPRRHPPSRRRPPSTGAPRRSRAPRRAAFAPGSPSDRRDRSSALRVSTNRTRREMATATLTKLKNFIDGELVDAADGETEPVLNPATGEPIAEAPISSAEDVDRAVGAARRAFETLVAHDSAGALRAPAGPRPAVRRPRRGAGRDRVGRGRQADRDGARGGDAGQLRQPALLRRGGATAGGQGLGRVRREPHAR